MCLLFSPAPVETDNVGDYDRLSPLPKSADVVEEVEEDDQPNWQFPPVLDEFNLIDVDVDPATLEEIFADKRSVTSVWNSDTNTSHLLELFLVCWSVCFFLEVTQKLHANCKTLGRQVTYIHTVF